MSNIFTSMENETRDEHGLTVASPANTEEIASTLRACSERSMTIEPIGSGSKLTWGSPVSAHLRLDTRPLSGLREHVWQDMTATVAAGTVWSAMQQQLAQHGQRVALDPLFADRATVGGVIATNDSGVLRRRFGSLRDLVLGMTIVLADGTIARSGGKVVKNVAGYDLPKLLTGSFGTLGIITEVTFRLHAIPAHTSSWTARSSSITALADLMHTLTATSSLSLEAMQLCNEDTGFALDVQLATAAEALAAQQQQLHQLTTNCTWTPASPGTWTAREQLFASPHTTILKITTLPSRLAAIVAGIALVNAQADIAAHCTAEPTGILTAALSAPAHKLAEILTDLRSRLRTHGGSAVVLQRGALPTTLDTWGDPPAAIDLMRAIKHEFDPQRLLNPGRFVGGI
jgi:glycolate oxidase FAD binding subunit